jgi:four helix bundle protein
VHVALHQELCSQLQRAAASTPRLVAEGYGRYYPADFARYLRSANGELKEIQDALRDGIDRGYFTQDQIVPLLRLSKRASKAIAGLIKYLGHAKPPRPSPDKQPRTPLNPPNAPNPPNPANPRNPRNPKNPQNPQNPQNKTS